mmetsp:Transcript_23489/g.41976  ORF Transcript_23489/g.41976 Transcript_23489/m.41976 type:complete len:106 (-) Transcript_23489:76-393(-)
MRNPTGEVCLWAEFPERSSGATVVKSPALLCGEKSTAAETMSRRCTVWCGSDPISVDLHETVDAQSSVFAEDLEGDFVCLPLEVQANYLELERRPGRGGRSISTL